MPSLLKTAAAALVAATSGLALSAAAYGQAADDLTLRRAMLSTGGVGYFEYEAMVTDTAALALEVRLDQVDDVLKSLVVYDDDGRLGEISLPGRQPLREVFRGLPFDADALTSPTALLNALRGAEIRSDGARQIEGRIIAVVPEEVRLPDGSVVGRHRLSVMTDSGLRQLVLEEAESVQFVDAQLQDQVDEALAALARHNQRDRREIAIRLNGTGERLARVAYVAEVPLWKASYRLTLAADASAEEADLQGWAVIENLTGDAWTDIELTVVAGNPVTFRQALYEAYFVERPELPVEVIGRVLPQTDLGQMPALADAQAFESRRAAAGAIMGMLTADSAAEEVPRPQAAPPPTPIGLTAAASIEAATQVLFTFPAPVSVDSGHSLLLPVVDRALPVERLSLYQPGTHPIHPLASVRLANDGESGLPPGILTLYERDGDGRVAFVGDAQLAPLPVGEDRLISFAVDERVRVDREERGSQRISQGRIVDGVLQLTLTDRTETVYRVAGDPSEDRLVVIEHPRQAGWDLVTPSPEEASLTNESYRLTVNVAAGEAEAFTVAMERPRHQRVQLIDIDNDQIAVFAAAEQLSDDLRDAVAALASFRADLGDAETALAALNLELDAILADQDRIRRNLDAVSRDSDLYERYLETLGEQEDRVETLGRQIQQAREAVSAARRALVNYARGLDVPG